MRKFLKTGHPMEVIKTGRQLPDLDGKEDFTDFWEVKLIRKTWYVAKGHKDAPRQVCVWYPNGKMWSSYGKSIEDAMNLAIVDAFLYI